MAGDIYVTFGGDTAALEASIASAKASVASLQRELASLARQQVATGAGADSEIGQQMLAMAAKVTQAKGALAGFKGDLAGLSAASGGLVALGEGAKEGAAGVEISAGEIGHAIHAMAELAEGETGRAKNAMISLAVHLGAANPELVGIGAVALAAAAGLAYLAYEGYESGNALDSIKNAAVVDQLAMTDEAAAKLRDTIKDLANVSSSDAADIARTFMAIGQGGPEIAEISSTYLPMLAAALGEKAPEAAKKLAEAFADLHGKGRTLVTDTDGVSAATIKAYDSYVAAGESGKAYATIIDAMISRYEASREAAAKAAAAHRAQGLAATAAGEDAETFKVIEQAAGDIVAGATAKIDAQVSMLRGLQVQLAGAADGAKTFAAALGVALKLDKVGSDIAKTTGEIELMKNALATANAKGDALGAAELTAGIDRASDALKKMQQQASDGLLGRDLVAQTKEQITLLDDTFKGSTVSRLQSERAMLAGLLDGDKLTAAQRNQVEIDLAAKDKEIRDASYKAFESGEEAQATAAALNKAKVIAIREDELHQAIAIYGEGSEQALAAEQKVAQAKEAAAKQGVAAATKGAKDELGATVERATAEVQVIEKATADKIALYAKEAQAKQITEGQKVALTLAALQQGLAAEEAGLAKELAIDGLSLKQKQALLDQENRLEQNYADQVVKIQEDAAAKTAQQWNSAMTSINSAFTSQINGLLTGTTNWHQAFINVLKDLTENIIKFFVDWGLQQAETFARNIISQNAWVAANITGNSLITASNAASAGAATTAVVAQKTAIVASDSGQAGAGVAAFLAPFLGPAAIPAGTAAAASVMAIGSADIGMWDVPSDRMTLIHQNELVMPAAQAGAFRDMLTGANAQSAGGSGKPITVAPTTNFHIHANDSASVAQWVRSNGAEIAKGLDQAARHGAMLGLRGLR